MSGYDDMDIVELQHEYRAALERACAFAREIAQDWEAGNWAHAAGVFVAFKAQDAQVRRLKRLLTVEAA